MPAEARAARPVRPGGYPFACCGAYRYGEVIRRLIWRYKFEGARWLYAYLADEMLRALLDEAFDLVCFVPLHSRRLAWRGFNQSQLLAERIALGRGCPVHSGARAHPQHACTGQAPARRTRSQCRGCVCPAAGAAEVLSGRRVLLVDDVVTTGATIGGCREQLRAAGAEVLCAAFTVTAGAGIPRCVSAKIRYNKNRDLFPSLWLQVEARRRQSDPHNPGKSRGAWCVLDVSPSGRAREEQ